jgi:hypothetical protein
MEDQSEAKGDWLHDLVSRSLGTFVSTPPSVEVRHVVGPARAEPAPGGVGADDDQLGVQHLRQVVHGVVGSAAVGQYSGEATRSGLGSQTARATASLGTGSSGDGPGQVRRYMTGIAPT